MWNDNCKKQRQHHRSILPSAPVVSIGCSRLRSCRFLPPSHSPLKKLDPPKPTSKTSSSSSKPESCSRKPRIGLSSSVPGTRFRDGRSMARAYWERIRQLESELVQLEKLLDAEKDLIDHINALGKKEIGDGTHDQFLEEEDIVTLKGGDLIKMLGGRLSHHNLLIHTSPPVVAEIGSTAFEVLINMSSMRREDLIDCLIEAMPMENINGCNMEGIISTSTSRHEKGFVKESILDAMERIEGLSMEGLKLQASASLASYNPTTTMKKKVQDRFQTDSRTQKESIVVVVLIQMRDPVKDNKDVGDPMIGLIEVSTQTEEKNNCVRRRRRRSTSVDGVHIAGLKHTLEGGFIWSISWKGYYGLWDNCSCRFQRNANISFTTN